MIDIGVNLLHPQYDGDREAVLRRALAAGVQQLLVTGTSVAESLAAQAFAASYPGFLYCTAGVHPHAAAQMADTASPDWLQTLETLSGTAEVVALGEMGLDYYRDYSTPAQQQQVLRLQLELASALHMPVFAHDRDASTDMIHQIESSGIEPSQLVIHCFTGGERALANYLSLGCMIGITGWVCDRKRGAPLRALVAKVPLERLLIETDGPFLRPANAPKTLFADAQPRPSSRRNEPALLPYVVQELATAMDISEAAIIAASSANAHKLFPKLSAAALPERPRSPGERL